MKTDISQSQKDFLKQHPFTFHSFWVNEGKAWHRNSHFKGYNDDTEQSLLIRGSYVLCDSADQFLNEIKRPSIHGRSRVILTTLDYEQIFKIEGVIDHRD